MPKLRIIDTSRLAAVPWKNGGGLTREVAQAPGPMGFVWRLSLADVAADGAFSRFPGMTRVLTVIEGQGLRLRSPSKLHDVSPFVPFTFRGDLDITSVLDDGAIRNLNVFFDPDQINAEVRVVNGPAQDRIGVLAGNTYAIFSIRGTSVCNGTTLRQGNCALIKDEALSVAVPKGCKALYVQLSSLSASV